MRLSPSIKRDLCHPSQREDAGQIDLAKDLAKDDAAGEQMKM